MKYITTVEGKDFTIEVNREGEVVVNGEPRELDARTIDNNGLYSLLINHQSTEALVELDEASGEYRVLIDGALYHISVTDERAKRLAEAAGQAFGAGSGEYNMKSPMPGLIVAIPVKEGDSVTKGQVIVVLESMKMENELKSPRDGIVQSIKIQSKQAVEQGQLLVVIS